jgi:aerobic C4-dicarboxylate transport protein
MRRPRFYSHLYFWVLVGMLLGVVNGQLFPHFAVQLKPLGDAFIRLIRMMIAPIIFTTVVVGIAGMDNLKRVGRIGLKAFVYFEVMTTLALALGWVVVKIFQPGAGMNADLSRLNTADLQATLTAAKAHHSMIDFVLNIIPRTIVGAFAEGEILQVLFFSVIFGVAMGRVGEANRPVINALEQISKALMSMIAMIIKFAPLAVFGAMSFTIAKFGLSSLLPLAKLMGCVYLTCFFFVVFCLGSLLWWNGIPVWSYLRYLRDELFIVFGTASSEPVFPRLMAKLEQLGCSRPLVGIVLPAGYSFNLDGTSIYLTMGALFIAQATNTHLTFGQELGVLVVCLLTSKGAAAVVGSAFITLAATLSSMHTIPVEGMVLILGVDWFMAEARAMTNMLGNGVASIVVARWESEFDQRQALRTLHGEPGEGPQPAMPVEEAEVETARELPS